MTTVKFEQISGEPLLDTPLPHHAIKYASHADALIDVYLPQGTSVKPVDLVIYIHGGYWRSRVHRGHSRAIMDSLAAQGAVAMTIEYRRRGAEAQLRGGWPTTFDDVTAAISAARNHALTLGYEVRMVTLVGHSAGGHLALWYAARHPGVDRVVALAPVTDVHRVWSEGLGDGAAAEFLGEPADNIAAYAQAEILAGNANVLPETYVLHGTADDVVPVQHSQDFISLWSDAKLTLFEHAGHFEFIDPQSSVWQQTMRVILA